MDVARRAKIATTPTASTVSADATNDRNTVAIDNRLKGTPQTHPRIIGAPNPTSTAAMSVGATGYGVLSER
jgi:hypothetical protein